MSSYTPSTVPGCRTPHVWCGDGRSLYDAMGPEYYAAAVRFRESKLPRSRRRPAGGACRSKSSISKQTGVAAFDGGGLVLSRPDQHVAWRGNDLPADPLALIDRVRGAAIHAGHKA